MLSLIIPTYNGVLTIEKCLENVFAQETPWEFDVHIVDSGSTDGTLDVVRRFPVKLMQIPHKSFSHGGTRNLAAAKTHSTYVAFLVQDAEPKGCGWLRTLWEAVETTGAVGAFGSQEPRPDASLFSKWEMATGLPRDAERVVKRLANQDQWLRMSPWERFNLCFFHNANSCIRRDVLLQVPFREMPYGEDMDWAKRVLLGGYSIVYEPRAIVLHSHNRSVAYTFKRAYSDHSLVYELFGLELIDSPIALFRIWGGSVLRSIRRAFSSSNTLSTKFRQAASTSLHSSAQVLGTYLGSQSVVILPRWSFFRKMDRMVRSGV